MFGIADLAHKKSPRGPLIFMLLQLSVLEKIPAWRLLDQRFDATI